MAVDEMDAVRKKNGLPEQVLEIACGSDTDGGRRSARYGDPVNSRPLLVGTAEQNHAVAVPCARGMNRRCIAQRSGWATINVNDLQRTVREESQKTTVRGPERTKRSLGAGKLARFD